MPLSRAYRALAVDRVDTERRVHARDRDATSGNRDTGGARDTIDYLVAAATERLAAQLETLNVRHFPMLAPLRPAYTSR